jgi:hypothetical protein
MTTWTIATDAETAELRRRIAARFPLVSPHKIARLALRYGIRSIERAPELLIEEAAAASGTDAEVQS